MRSIIVLINFGTKSKMYNRYYNSEATSTEIANLTERFENVCYKYKATLSARDSNRSSKELSKGNIRGTTIHKFQCNFAWILHDIECGPRYFMDSAIQNANRLINHIAEISNK